MDGPVLRAWRPAVEGIAEVFHARFGDHAYPLHTHDTWTLLIIDDGAVRYGLDRHQHGALGGSVTLLPPHVPHDGRDASGHGFRKRVLYLEGPVLDADLIGAAVDAPTLVDARLRQRLARLHETLESPADAFEASSRLALVVERVTWHLRRRPEAAGAPPQAGLAERLRELLDERASAGVTLDEAARALDAHPTSLVRAFTRRFGLPPHRYLTGRRVDLARRLLLAGAPPAEVAVTAGFYDQSHLHRHFKRYLGVGPASYLAP